MDKSIIKVISFEDKTARTGRTYTRFNTNVGYANAFDDVVIEPLKKLVGRSAEVIMVTDNEKGYKNIREFIAEVITDPMAEIEVSKGNQGVTSSGNKSTTMYVSYCKDLLVSGKVESMDEAIELIKKSKDSFS
jgi:hypothetical protein